MTKLLIVKIIKRISFYYIYIKSSILYIFYKKYFLEIKKIKGREKAYIYLKNKYSKFLNNLPIYENTNQFSNYVWWCWLQGEENAPDLNKACLNSLRKNLKDRKIIVITEDNYKEYVDFPNYIIKKYQKGYITRTHFSDLLRTELLVKYGGTWIDSSVLCTSYDDNYFDKNLFVFKSWMTGDDSIVASSWFITSEKNNPILLTTKNLLYKYWKDHKFLIHYYVFHFMFNIACDKYKNQFDKIDKYSNLVNHILQFELLDEYTDKRYKQITNMTSVHKLTQKIDFSKCNGNTFYDHIIKIYK